MPDGELLLDLADVDWFRDRIRIWWEVQDGPTWPLGTFMSSSASDEYQDGWVSKPVELLDKPAVLQQDAVPRSYSLEAGTVVTAAIANLILEAGETARSEEHTSELQSRENLVCRLLLEKKKEDPRA